MNDIINVFYTHKGRYGYRRIYLEIRKLYPTINHKTIQRLMHKMGLFGNTPKAKYKSYKGNMNGTVENHLLEKVVDEENHITYYKRNFSTCSSLSKLIFKSSSIIGSLKVIDFSHCPLGCLAS